MLLLTDGSVIVQGLCSNLWYRLTPDASGNYANGTWSQIASMSSRTHLSTTRRRCSRTDV